MMSPSYHGTFAAKVFFLLFTLVVWSATMHRWYKLPTSPREVLSYPEVPIVALFCFAGCYHFYAGWITERRKVYVLTNVRVAIVVFPRSGTPVLERDYYACRFDKMAGCKAVWDRGTRFGDVRFNEVVRLASLRMGAEGDVVKNDIGEARYGAVRHDITNVEQADDLAHVMRRLIAEQKELREEERAAEKDKDV